MATFRLRTPAVFHHGFAQIRGELRVPAAFPPGVLDAADLAVNAPLLKATEASRRDARDLQFIAIDPPGATDLDQAFSAARTDNGFRVFYAIADLGAFLIPEGVIDQEARSRGTTLYSPDLRTPLHPPIISEDHASLLAGTVKPSLLWTIDLDQEARVTRSHLERATVKVSEAISYTEAQQRIDAGNDEILTLLKEVGSLRQALEAERGGVSLSLPSQEVVEHSGSYRLEYDTSLPVEGWNAQISLLTGMVAGKAMYEAGTGILRTLPPTRKQDLRRLRIQAKALDVYWPDDVAYADFVRGIEPTSPKHNAFLVKAARSFRGAGYLGFHNETPDHPEHGAIASVYAHVTAPLRRLVDRFGNEILLALYADTQPPTWAIEALEELPSLMGRAKSKDGSLERAMVNFTEAVILERRIGESFEAFVVDLDKKRDRAIIQLSEPAVVAPIDPAGLELAQEVTVTLKAVDTAKRSLEFVLLDQSAR